MSRVELSGDRKCEIAGPLVVIALTVTGSASEAAAAALPPRTPVATHKGIGSQHEKLVLVLRRIPPICRRRNGNLFLL
jgi:hypothetical protein